ncbi:ROK family transcriptional regulator [Cohnella herbarum]|uniref:ROK family transcriptional regulator n=1 Tax=Cohnella herbarum TaxID=2728023 RepID=A0A7Z2VRE7_9BACL|nr:ROK family transcriptional regulator [Cohnella herbarum]QJD87764.1 ROK family transcriptional regulator [Cohnella herbarum]
MKAQKGNLQLMKKINCSLILHMLLRNGSLSRAEIAQRSKLSATTVSTLVDELIQQNLIDEVGEKSSPGAGRKAIALEISRDKGYIIGISLGNNEFHSALLNFRNEIVYEFKSEVVRGKEAVLKFMVETINRLLESEIVKDPLQIKGIAISTPGVINDTGEIIFKSTLLRIDNLEIKRLLRREFDYPVIVVNDTKAAAYAEYFVGNVRSESLFFLSMDTGIGMALVIDGKVHSGYGGLAGEIGHMLIDPYGQRCEDCGQIGCIAMVLTEPAILEHAQLLAKQRKLERIPLTFDELLERYEEGEALAEETISRVNYLLVHALSVFINFISPELVVLHGWIRDSDKFVGQLKKGLAEFPFPLPFDENRVVTATFGDKNFIIGASTLMLHKVFEDYF